MTRLPAISALTLAALTLAALLLAAGCLGTTLPARQPPAHPGELTNESARTHANASETHRFYTEARNADATTFAVTCRARTDAQFGAARVVPVSCTGGYELAGFGGEHADVFGSALYVVNRTGSRRLGHDAVSIRGEYVDGGVSFRLYNLDDQPHRFRVRVTTGRELATDTVSVEAGTGLTWRLPAAGRNATLTVSVDGQTVERRIVRTISPAPGQATAVYVGPNGTLAAGRGPGHTDGHRCRVTVSCRLAR